MWVSKKRFEELEATVDRLEDSLKSSQESGKNLVDVLVEAGFLREHHVFAGSSGVLRPIVDVPYYEFVRDIESYLGIEKVSEPPRYQKKKSQN